MILQLLTLTILGAGLGYSALFKGGVRASDWNVTLILTGVAALIYWLSRPARPKAHKMSPWLWIPIAILPLYALFQVLPLPESAFALLSPQRVEQTEALRRIAPTGWVTLSVFPPATVGYFFRMLAYLTVLLTIREITWLSSGGRWAVAIPLLVVGGLEAGLGMLQVAKRWPGGMAQGTYVDRDHFAGLLEMVLPFAVMYAIAIQRRADRRERSPAGAAFAASAAGGITALMLVGIIYSLSRMGFLVAICSLFVVTLMSVGPRLVSRRVRWVSIATLGAAALLCFVFLPPDQLIARFADLASTDRITTDDRLHMWRETLPLIRAYPLFGCGLGGFESAFGQFQIAMPTMIVDYAHNDYLQFAAELGIAGSLILGTLLTGILYAAIGATLKQTGMDGRSMAIASLGSMIAMMLHSLVDFNMQIPANGLTMAWIAGIALGLDVRARGRAEA